MSAFGDAYARSFSGMGSRLGAQPMQQVAPFGGQADFFGNAVRQARPAARMAPQMPNYAQPSQQQPPPQQQGQPQRCPYCGK